MTLWAKAPQRLTLHLEDIPLPTACTFLTGVSVAGVEDVVRTEQSTRKTKSQLDVARGIAPHPATCTIPPHTQASHTAETRARWEERCLSATALAWAPFTASLLTPARRSHLYGSFSRPRCTRAAAFSPVGLLEHSTPPPPVSSSVSFIVWVYRYSADAEL